MEEKSWKLVHPLHEVANLLTRPTSAEAISMEAISMGVGLEPPRNV